jgi:hypothetical protein
MSNRRLVNVLLAAAAAGAGWIGCGGTQGAAQASGLTDASGASATSSDDSFSGTLETGAALTGVTPAIGPDASVVIDRSQDFTLAWTAEGRAGECVSLTLEQVSSNGVITCNCWVPDSLGGLTVSTSTLGGFGTKQLAASVRLERLRVSTTSSGNATIALVSEVAQSADVTFE